MKSWFYALSLAVVLASCGAEARPYGSPRQIVTAMANAGLDCEGLESAPFSSMSDDSYRSLVAERGVCRVGGRLVVITTFASAQDREDWVAVGGLLGPLAVGPNWAVSSRSGGIVTDIAEALDAPAPDDP